MQLNNKPLLYILLAIIPVSCIEPYFPDDISYEPMVFIQALVTDNPDTEPYVQISNTQPLMNGQEIVNPYIDVNGATVYIERDDATRYYFAERPWWGFGGGYYYLPDPSFTLTPGSSYNKDGACLFNCISKNKIHRCY